MFKSSQNIGRGFKKHIFKTKEDSSGEINNNNNKQDMGYTEKHVIKE